jgi:hypothetical protein
LFLTLLEFLAILVVIAACFAFAGLVARPSVALIPLAGFVAFSLAMRNDDFYASVPDEIAAVLYISLAGGTIAAFVGGLALRRSANVSTRTPETRRKRSTLEYSERLFGRRSKPEREGANGGSNIPGASHQAGPH